MNSLTRFAQTFPVLRPPHVPTGILDALDERDFDAVAEWLWKDEGALYWAMVFVLSVWNPGLPESLGLKRFDLHRAMGVWDDEQRRAFAQWAEEPRWF